jgi:8-oxo-dGTP pyrophosphatase MutT (NUDIX family)
MIYSRSSNRFLMELRGRDVGNPNTYGFFGGGVEPGELPEEACRRELMEEAALSVKRFDHAVKLPSKSAVVFLFVKILKHEFVPELSWESGGYRWVNDIEDVKPLHKKILMNYGEIRRLMAATRNQCQEPVIESPLKEPAHVR